MTNPDADPRRDAARIAEIRQRADRATGGDWRFRVIRKGDQSDGMVLIGAVAPGHQIRSNPLGGSYPANDGEFIAHARQDVPWLLDQLQQAEAACRMLQQQLVEQRAELTGHLSEAFKSMRVCYDTPADHYREMVRRVVEDRDVQKHRAREAEAARLALQRQMEWQPIETAPKDGTRLLLARKQRMSGELIVVSGYWNSGGAFHMPHWSTSSNLFDPTHWMPLPPLPETEGDGPDGAVRTSEPNP